MSSNALLEWGKEASTQFLERNTLMKRETPKINGSFGGFIALVVCLLLIIIASSTAVFFLLREQRRFDEEQARRRRGRYQSESNTRLHAPKRSFVPKLWRTRLTTLLNPRNTKEDTQARSDASQVKMKRGGEHGWVQAGSVDDWDSDSSFERRQATGQLGVHEMPSPKFSHIYSTRSPVIHPAPVSRSASGSTSSVRFDLHAVRGLGYPDGHRSPHPTLPNIHSQLSSPSYTPAPSPIPIRTTSPETISNDMTSDDDSLRPTAPGASVRSFPGGTKFIEDL